MLCQVGCNGRQEGFDPKEVYGSKSLRAIFTSYIPPAADLWYPLQTILGGGLLLSRSKPPCALPSNSNMLL